MKKLQFASRQGFVAALLVFGVACAASAQLHRPGGWIRLGDSHVDGHNDHDKIKPNNHGPFVALRLHVTGSAVKFDHIIVHFNNGQNEQIRAEFVVANNSSSPDILIPGARRNIDSVEMWYERGNWGSKPQVALFGRM
jgi:hypothetical protein